MLAPNQHERAQGEENGDQCEPILNSGTQQDPKPKRTEDGWSHRTNRAVNRTETARYSTKTIGQFASRLFRSHLVHVVSRALRLQEESAMN